MKLSNKKRILQLLSVIVILSLISYTIYYIISTKPQPIITSGQQAFIQETGGASFGGSSAPTCAFGSNVGFNHLIEVSFALDSQTITVTSVTDTLGLSFTDAGILKPAGTTVLYEGDVYYAFTGSNSGPDTITVHLSGTANDYISCAEFSRSRNVLRVSEMTNTGTVTSGTISASLPSFSPTNLDTVYIYVFYQTCGNAGTITYDTHYTAGTAKGTDFNTATVCKTGGTTIRWHFNSADEYQSPASTTANTATFSIPSLTVDTQGTRGWGEIGLEFDQFTLQPITESISGSDVVNQLDNKNVQTEQVTITDNMLNSNNKHATESISLSDSISNSKFISIAEAISLTDSISQLDIKLISESIGITDFINYLKSTVLSESISITDSISLAKVFPILINETISIVDNISKFSVSFINENISIIDSILKLHFCIVNVTCPASGNRIEILPTPDWATISVQLFLISFIILVIVGLIVMRSSKRL